MQAEALRSLKAIRDKAKDKALIISATGTGKTILCALDVREVNPNKFLFIVHNEGILNRAKEEFKKVLPIKNDSDFGLLTGNIEMSMPNIYLQPFKHYLEMIILSNLMKMNLIILFLMKHIVLLHLLINEYLTTSNLSSCWE